MKKESYQSIFNSMPFGFAYHKIILDKGIPIDYVFLEVNEAFEEITGLKKQNILNRTFKEVFPSPPVEEFDWISLFGAVALGGEAQNFEQYSHQMKRCFNVHVSSHEKNYFTTIFRDITERKIVENENSAYRKIFESINQPLIVTDKLGNIQNINRAFTEMYGFQDNEVLGKNPAILNPGREVYENLGYSKKDYDSLFGNLWKSIQNSETGQWKDIVINRKKNGSLIWVELMINALYDLQGNITHYIALPIDISTLKYNEKLGRVELVQTIASLAELRDDITGNHMKRVGYLSRILAEDLGLPDKFCEDIGIFAPMHDIGKVGIKDSLLLAKRKLTEDEFREIQSHTQLGYNIVSDKKELTMVAEITLGHHEKIDGSGYPRGIKGNEIPLSARITALVDIYDALRSKRPYKDSWTHEESCQEIIRLSGTHLDPEIVEHFKNVAPRFNKIFNELYP
jgi:PAS domain S-box-containing protein